MPELPEITVRAREMNAALTGRRITGIEVLQPKCLNVPVETFAAALTGAQLLGTTQRGKWLVTDTTQGWLLLNLGMGGEILLVTRDRLPEKRRLIFDFADGAALSVNFWWFGYAHHLPPGPLAMHERVGKLGPNALDLTTDDGRRTTVSGQRSAVVGQRSAVSGQRSVVGGQRSAVGGRRSAVGGRRSSVTGVANHV